MERFYLVGSEDVKNAAYVIRDAAENMRRVVGNMDDVLFRHRQYMEEWLQRYEACLKSS